MSERDPAAFRETNAFRAVSARRVSRSVKALHTVDHAPTDDTIRGVAEVEHLADARATRTILGRTRLAAGAIGIPA